MEVHLVDGTFELFRAYYGAPSFLSPSGVEVGATRSFLRNMKSFVLSGRATHLAIAFDTVIESFRNDIFAGYKTGEGLDPEIFNQFSLVEEGTQALGIVTWPMVEFEADDALATAARKYAKYAKVDRVVICSPDKDLMQCIDGEKIVCLDRLRNKLYRKDDILEKFGIEPGSIPDYLALVGDDADGIPGIAKWGAKSSATLLQHYKHIENIPSAETAWGVQVRGAKALAQNLNNEKKAALLYKKLATLRYDVPLSESLSALQWRGPNSESLQNFAMKIGDPKLAHFVE